MLKLIILYNAHHIYLQYAPSVFMYEMGLSTDERTALQMREPKIPKILEFLDMGQTSYQRVCGLTSKAIIIISCIGFYCGCEQTVV